MALILHIDDDKNTRLLLGANLEERGHVYEGTDSVMTLLGHMRTKGSGVGLVLVDEHMTPQKGSEIVPTLVKTYDTLQRLDPVKYARRPPIILCSGVDESDLALLVKRCGADGHLNKALLSGSENLFDLFYQRIDAYVRNGHSKKPA